MIAGGSEKWRTNVVMASSPGRNDEDEREIKHPVLVLPGQRVLLVICIIIHSKYFPVSNWLKPHA